MVEASEGSITSVDGLLFTAANILAIFSVDGIDISKLGLEDLRTRVVSISFVI